MWRADIEVPNTTVYVNYWVVSACYPRGNFYPLSDDHSILNRLITKSCFRTCSTCRSRSQAYSIPLRSANDFQPFWVDLWTPPLLFRRRPPQSNCPPDTVPEPDNGTRLEIQSIKGGIPRLTPIELASYSQRLPPILYIINRISISSYSKAPRGLSVLSRVTCIFTGIKISPSLWLRQYPDHYAFRAGQNLPDKEFRYLRTVIVTAAVHWGFNSKLRIFDISHTNSSS